MQATMRQLEFPAHAYLSCDWYRVPETNLHLRGSGHYVALEEEVSHRRVEQCRHYPSLQDSSIALKFRRSNKRALNFTIANRGKREVQPCGVLAPTGETSPVVQLAGRQAVRRFSSGVHGVSGRRHSLLSPGFR